jgi:hypothetical protein
MQNVLNSVAQKVKILPRKWLANATDGSRWYLGAGDGTAFL